MRALDKILPGLLLAILISTDSLPSQTRNSTSHIVDNIDENHLVMLRGNTPPAATAKNDQGPTNPSMAMTDLILVLKRSPEQQAEFDALVESQYDPTSPNFHRWLEPTEIGERFGPSPTDIGKISSWLLGHGLSVKGVSKDRMTIRFSGSLGQVEAAFHTRIHNLSLDGEAHFSNMTDPQIPMALEPVVIGPKALHNFVPRPTHQLGGTAARSAETGRWERTAGILPFEFSASGTKLGPQPELGIKQGVGASAYVIEDVTPYDFATIYNVLPLWNDSIDGQGQTIAIAGRSDVRATDVASFRSMFGLPAAIFNTIHNGPDPGYCTGTAGLCTLTDQVENALDVEWAGAIAKNATIELVVTQQTASNDAVYESSSYVIDHGTAPILSVSYGLCELFLGSSGNAAYNSLWQTAAAKGIAVFVASGDAGAATCDQGRSSTTPYSAQFGLTVNGLASSPFGTAVGGTEFTWCNPSINVRCASGSPYWGATNTTTGANAQSYIPEVPWNDTCTTPAGIAYIKSVSVFAGLGSVTDAESACNFINNYYSTIFYRYGINLSFLLNVKGTGGGASSCTVSDGSNAANCSGGHAKPSWQNGVAGVPNDGRRDLPDLSFFAGAGFLNSAYLICVSDMGNCLTETSPVYRPTGGEVGGTSVGTPAMAGVMALINQKAGSTQGNPNSELYELAKLQNYSRCQSEGATSSNGCIFNDIDTGTNGMVCTAGSPNCTVSISGDKLGVLSGHGASAGYDLATGLGTLNVANLVNAWPSPSGTITPLVTLAPSSNSFNITESLSVVVTVQGSNSTPTGTVTLSGGGYTSSAQTLSSGSVSFNIPANSFKVGSNTLTAAYSGDLIYTATSGTAAITVTEAPKLTPTVTIVPASNSIHANETLTVSVSVAASGGTPTGTVTLSGAGYTSSPQTVSSGSTSFNIPANSLTVGTDTLTASYSGDSAYTAASSTTTITVIEALKLTPAVTIMPASNSTHINETLSVSVTVAGSGSTPTGTVTLSGGGYASSTQTLSSGSASFTISANSLKVGSNALTAAYSGDSIYTATSGTTTVTVTEAVKLTPTVRVTPASNNIRVNENLSVTVAVEGSRGMPTGSVTVSSVGYTSSAKSLSSGRTTFTIPGNSLSIGSDILTATYSGDPTYAGASGTTTIKVDAAKSTPAITITPASNNITRTQTLNVTVVVSGSETTATGTVTLIAGGYAAPTTILVAGVANFAIPPNTLAPGTTTLTANYGGDAAYLSGTNTTQVTVSKLMPTLLVSPDSISIHPGKNLNVRVTVSGPAEIPTGTVRLSGAGYTSPDQTLSDGNYTFIVPAGALSIGSHTLTMLYSGDDVYVGSSTSTEIQLIPGSYALSASAPAAISGAGSAASTITVSSNDGYSGTVTLSCVLTAFPSGAAHLPTCSVESGTVTLTSSIVSGTRTVVVTTSGFTGAHARSGDGFWVSPGTVLACLVLFLGPRRGQRSSAILSALIMLIFVASIAACGGSGIGANSGAVGGGDSTTTAGTYSFNVSGNGNPAINPTPTTSFSVTVN